MNDVTRITVQNVVDLCNAFNLEKSKTTIDVIRFTDFLKIYLSNKESFSDVIVRIFDTSIVISELTEKDCVTKEYSSISEFLNTVDEKDEK